MKIKELEIPLVGPWAEEVRLRPDPIELLVGLMAADATIICTGPSQVAHKTWLVFQAAICLASGKSVEGIVPVIKEGIPILIIEEENLGALKGF